MIPESEIETLRRVDLAALARGRGISLSPRGKDLVGLCPFHEDTNPSLVITPGKNLFHCFSCGAGGDPIEFVMKLDRIDFPEAVQRLRGAQAAPAVPVPAGRPQILTAADAELLSHVIDHYHRTLKNHANALRYLTGRGLASEEAFVKFRIGYSDGSLGSILPSGQSAEGARMREFLRAFGIFKPMRAEEPFESCITFPVFENGVLTGLYGRRITRGHHRSRHLYLPGPHRGIWNPEALQGPELILCESIIDAFTFYVNGMRNVSCAYGTEGFTAQMLAALSGGPVRKVFIAYDGDMAGNRAAGVLAQRLAAHGIECLRVRFPMGMDANDFALKVRPASESLRDLLLQATPFVDEESPVSVAELPAVAPAPAGPECELEGEEVRFRFSQRKYRVRGLFKNTTDHLLKVNLRVSLGERYHLDTLDLLQAKARTHFIEQAALELAVDADLIKFDTGRILDRLEEILAAKQKEKKPESSVPEIPEERRLLAIEYLKAPDLIENIVLDFEKMGLVGEGINSLIGYLGSLSRKTDAPLAIIIQSSSSAGKSTLMEAILAMVPEEDRVKYSFMTGQSLFYMQSQSLKHRILAISEEEGVEKARYAIKILQSEHKVSIATTIKDPDTGMPDTKEFVVEGPVMILITTTNVEIAEELQNRALVLTINEEREQTRLIQQLQRERRTIDGIMQKRRQHHHAELHQDIQRILRPLAVAIPDAPGMDFPDTRLRLRRDQEKFLTMIESIALLHQHQRPVKTRTDERGTVEYIEATRDDVALAGFLCAQVFGISLDELAPQTRRLLGLMEKMVREESARQSIELREYRFTRRMVREYTGWSDSRLKIHLARLEDLEYLLVRGGGRGQLIEYALVHPGESRDGPFLPGIRADLKPELLNFLNKKSGLRGQKSGQKGEKPGGSQAPVRGKSGGGSFSANAKFAGDSALRSIPDDFASERAKERKRPA